MFELIGLIATAAVAAVGYFQSRAFVRHRLRYVDAVQKTGVQILAGAAAWLVAMPIVALLPLVGGMTAIVFGLAVGTGVAAGAKDIRRRLPSGT